MIYFDITRHFLLQLFSFLSQLDQGGRVKPEDFVAYIQRSYAEDTMKEEIKNAALECAKVVNLRAKGE
jgi:hypothetical protein